MAEPLTLEILSQLVPPPGVGADDICVICQTWSDLPGDSKCSNCKEIEEKLGAEPVPISVISLYRKPSQMREWLTFYKKSPEEGKPALKEYQQIIQHIIVNFFLTHLDNLQEKVGGFDAVVVVPSTLHEPPHPLTAMLSDSGLPISVVSALERGEGELSFRNPSRDGFKLAQGVDTNQRVLIFDDVYTTGARINSAAVALQDSGIVVVGALVLARRVNPGYLPAAHAFWERQTSINYSMENSPYLQGRNV